MKPEIRKLGTLLGSTAIDATHQGAPAPNTVEDEDHIVQISTEWVPDKIFGDSVNIHVTITSKRGDPNSPAYQGILLELVPAGRDRGLSWAILSRVVEGAWFQGSYFSKVEPARYSLRLVDPHDEHWVRIGIPNPEETDENP